LVDEESVNKRILRTTSKQFREKIILQQFIFNILAGGFWNAEYHFHPSNTRLVVFSGICLAVIVFNNFSFEVEAENNRNQRRTVFIRTILKTALGMFFGALLYYFYLLGINTSFK